MVFVDAELFWVVLQYDLSVVTTLLRFGVLAGPAAVSTVFRSSWFPLAFSAWLGSRCLRQVGFLTVRVRATYVVFVLLGPIWSYGYACGWHLVQYASNPQLCLEGIAVMAITRRHPCRRLLPPLFLVRA